MKTLKKIAIAIALMFGAINVSAQDVNSYTPETAEMVLKMLVPEMSKELPETMEVGFVLDEVRLNPKNLVFHFTIDSAMYPIEDLACEDGKVAVKNMVIDGSESSQALVSVLKVAKRGLEIIFTGSPSGEEAVVEVSPDEL